MSPKVFIGLLVVTLIAAGAAVVTALQQPSAAPVRYVDEPAFPDLRANPDAVAKVMLTTPAGRVTLVRETGDRWSALELFGYAVDRQRVRALIVALADMRLIEAKTRLPERYGRLEVEDVDGEDAKSRLLRVERADGQVLAEALLGKQQHRLTGDQAAGTYLRRPGDAQAWLASGGVSIDPEALDWLDGEIVDLDGASLRRIEIRPPAGPAYVGARAAAGAPLTFEGLAPGEVLKPDADPEQLASAFAAIRLEGVKPRAELTWPGARHTAIATTFDGVELTVQLAKIDDQPWAIFFAREVAAVTPPAAAAPGENQDGAAAAAPPAAEADTTPPDGAAATPADDEAAAAIAADATAAGRPEPPRLTAGEINERVSSWAYQIPTAVFDRLTRPRTEWLEDSGTS